MDMKAGATADGEATETLLERAVRRQITRLNEAEKRRKTRGREAYRRWRLEVLEKV